MKNIKFEDRKSVQEIEEGKKFSPKFDNNGLIPCITTHSKTKEILMFSYMNKKALKETILTRFAHYWSRSRQSIWKKGETSGMFHNIKKILIDDDQDSILLEVTLTLPKLGGSEASCHVGYRSCFYRELKLASDNTINLKFTEKKKVFDPKVIYQNIKNPTQI